MFKKFLFILAIILSGTATFLTAGGMVALFSGLWALFITIDIARFFVTDYLIKSWKWVGKIKYFTTTILFFLLLLSSVGVYNSLDQRIPKTMHEAIVEAASYNRANINSQTSQDIHKTGYEIALQEYNSQVSAYEVQKEACLNKENSDQEKCIRTYNTNINSAKKRLDTAKSDYTKSIEKSTETNKEENINKTEIAGILTTICSFTGGNCDTTSGLTRALRIIILLIIIGLEIFSINILFIIHSDKHTEEPKKGFTLPKIKNPFNIKKKVIEEPVKVEPVIEEIVEEPITEEVIEEEPFDDYLETDWDESEIDLFREVEEAEQEEDSKNSKNKKKIVTFDEVIAMIKNNPALLEMEKIKKALKNNPSLRQAIQKKLKSDNL